MNIVMTLGDATFRARPHGPLDAMHGIEPAARDVHALVDAGHRVVVLHAVGPEPADAASGADGAISLSTTVEAQAFARLGTAADPRLELALRAERGNERSFATLTAHAVVRREDPAFLRPSRFVGPRVDPDSARRLELSPWCTMAPDGAGYRRVLPEPAPTEVLQIEPIRSLLDGGHTVLCGTMTVVTRDLRGRYAQVDAVVDRDAAAALVADAIGADRLLMLTDVDGVHPLWPKSDHGAPPLDRIEAGSLDPGGFDAGTMRPKLQAALAFCAPGRHAVIGAVGSALAMLEGRAGTRIEP